MENGRKALFLGGTGLISNACTVRAVELGWRVTLVTRGNRVGVLPERIAKEVEFVSCDIGDDAALAKACPGSFDSVTQWLGFTPDRVTRDCEIFGGRAGQYIYISSCAAYERPLRRYLVTEDLPLRNRFWQYGRDKAASEDECTRLYRDKNFPVTVVRPSLTYGLTQIPFAMNAWGRPWSLVKRLLDGKPVVCHGDGEGLWTITHNTDFAKGFVGLMGNGASVGEAYHIVSDEVLTWNGILTRIANAAGVSSFDVRHISTDHITRFMPEMEGSIGGDKGTSYVFDNSKIKRVVPEFVCTTPFAEGIARTVEHFLANPSLRAVDEEWNAKIDALIAADDRFRP